MYYVLYISMKIILVQHAPNIMCIALLFSSSFSSYEFKILVWVSPNCLEYFYYAVKR